MFFLRADDFAPLADTELFVLARAIEAGLYAEQLLAAGGHAAATNEELRAIVGAGQAAMRRCVCTHLRFVAKLARETARRSGMCPHELFQEGCVGLLEAVKRFDHTRGVPFITFAAFWIRYHQGHLGDRSALGGRARARARRRLLRLADELCQQLGRSITEADLVALGEDRAADVLGGFRVVSIHGDDGDVEVADPQADGADQLQDLRVVGALLASLTDLERRVIELRFGLGSAPMLSGARAAETLGLSVSAVRRIESGAMGRLRAAGQELLAA